ncbi:gag-protease polyprotein, partial [Trifolium medium]|nr:gag-protease polyprotein [Trifolium medium]
GTVSKPPLLTGPDNYDYWKSRMTAFLKSIDSRTWKAIVTGWETPFVLDKDGNKTAEVKPEKDWSKDEDELSLGNSKALNAIFNGVDMNMFRLVKWCTVAKDAWEILRKAHEGTNKVKLSKLQMLSTNFENLCMKEEETIHDFHMNVLEFANSFDALGETISDEKLVSKILRSLPKRFDMKVTTIEETQDLATIQVDELIGSLQTYELGINQRKEKKNKSLAFSSNTGEEEGLGDLESDESLSEAMCHECEGYGHIKAECPTFLKRQKKSLAVSWSDEDDSEEETENESAKLVNALTGVCESDAESCDEASYKELVVTYKDLFNRSNEVCKTLEKQKKINCQLQAEKNDYLAKIGDLNKEIEKLNVDLEHARK